MKTTKFALGALGIVALVAAVQPVQAACNAPFLISSINTTTGYYAYVVNPTVTPGAGGEGYMGSTVTDQIDGFFWAVGLGNPAPGVGADSGTFEALDWLYIYPNYPASILTTWAASTGIDTCIDVEGGLGQRCQATFLQDVDTATGAGLFVLITTPDDPASGDYLLDNGGVNLTMAAQPKPTITASASTPAGCRPTSSCTGVDLTLQAPAAAAFAAAAFLSPAGACQGLGPGGGDPLNGLIHGARFVYQVLPRGSAPPSDFDAASWTPSAAPLVPLGGSTAVSIDCSSGNSDIYVSYQLALDSGFGAPFISNASTRIECGPNIAEPGRGTRVKPEGRQAPRTRER